MAHGHMLTDFADGTDTTRTHTGIHTLVALAGLVAGTVCIEDTLGTTTHIGITLEFGQTRTLSILADCIGATWRRIAGIVWYWRCVDHRWWLWCTANEGITLVASGAAADGHVLYDIALCRDATRAGTRIATLLVEAGQVGGTVRVENTLRLAVGWCTIVTCQAGAHSLAILGVALAIGTTG